MKSRYVSPRVLSLRWTFRWPDANPRAFRATPQWTRSHTASRPPRVLQLMASPQRRQFQQAGLSSGEYLSFDAIFWATGRGPHTRALRCAGAASLAKRAPLVRLCCKAQEQNGAAPKVDGRAAVGRPWRTRVGVGPVRPDSRSLSANNNARQDRTHSKAICGPLLLLLSPLLGALSWTSQSRFSTRRSRPDWRRASVA